jgi:N6-L-threonylcarbamoyladenine synthase
MTTQNNIGEGQSTAVQTAGRNPRVFVISSRGKPLMPTYASKARKLLKQGKAKVVQRTPFTIQLLGPSGGNVQPISLGVDAGTKYIGLSATTEKAVLFEAEVFLRTDIKELLAGRAQMRRARRSRKTRYRQAKFLNRKNRVGKLPPSVQNKVDVHVKMVRRVCALLPVSSITIETAQFDIQKIKNPNIQGVEYQQGPQMGFWNAREYVLFRDGHKCQHCHGKSKDKILNVHHVETRKTGGDSPDNLITLCATCHKTIHRDGLAHLFKRVRKSFRDAGHMTTMRKFVLAAIRNIHPDVRETFGYATKYTRIANGLGKSHAVDARCCSGNAVAVPTTPFLLKQVRGQNRQLHKANTLKGGVRKVNKAVRYVFGFQIFDKVVFKGQECFIFGRRSSGQFDLRLLDGTKVNAHADHKKLRLVEKASILLVQKGKAPPTGLEERGLRACKTNPW